MSVLSICIAGSTIRTLLCAKALAGDPRFQIVGVLTPSPKPIGRKQEITENPMHQWAKASSIPVTLVEKKLTQDMQIPACEYLLVVDFGYIVPQWLLDIPSIAPINIHPSALPNYRGSSPGQFVLAFGEKQSAVSVIVMDAKLDHGPIVTKLPFDVSEHWDASQYYDYAFHLIADRLGDILFGFSQMKHAVPQPDESPTPVARMLSREDGFIPASVLSTYVSNWKEGKDGEEESVPFFVEYGLQATAHSLFNLWRGLHPWPGLWTKISDGGQEKRVKLLSFHLEKDALLLDEIQVEGKTSQKYSL